MALAGNNCFPTHPSSFQHLNIILSPPYPYLSLCMFLCELHLTIYLYKSAYITIVQRGKAVLPTTCYIMSPNPYLHL